MRNFILFSIILAGSYWGYQKWNASETLPNEDNSVKTAVSGEDIPPLAEAQMVQQPPNIVPLQEQPSTSLSSRDKEILILRSELANVEPDSDLFSNLSLKLSKLLLNSERPESIGEARGILRTLSQGDPAQPNRDLANELLLQESSGADQLTIAKSIFEKGAQTPGFGFAAEILSENLNQDTSAGALQSWDLLSKAYVAAPDLETKTPIRIKLWNLVNTWVFSSKSFPEVCTTVTVVSGDSLSVIAQRHKSSVDAIKLLNGLRNDVIHPQQRLKILSGKVHVEVDKSDFRLDLFIDDRWLMGFPVGHGRSDKVTPALDYVVGVMQKRPMWQPRDGRAPIAHGVEGNPLGERWIGFKDGETFGLGIHGTEDPDSIGSMCSEGCVRLRNEDVITLYPWIRSGTPVSIRE